MKHRLGGGIEGRPPVKDIFRLVLQVFPTQAAFPVNEADDQAATRTQHPSCFRQSGLDIGDEADGSDQQNLPELGVREGQRLPNPGCYAHAALSRIVQRRDCRVDAE